MKFMYVLIFENELAKKSCLLAQGRTCERSYTLNLKYADFDSTLPKAILFQLGV